MLQGTFSDPGTSDFGHSFARVQVYGGIYRGAGESNTPEEETKKPQEEAKPLEEIKPLEETQPKAEEKPSGTTVISSPTRSTYTVDAGTLKEVAEIMKKRAENKLDAGRTEWRPGYVAGPPDENGKVASATATVGLEVTLPDWPGAANLSPAAKAEWDRAYQAIEAHEQGHIALVQQYLGSLGESLVGKSPAEARAVYDEALRKLKEASEAYDAETDHGRNHGTVINTEVSEEGKP